MWISTPYYFQGGCCKVCGEVTHLARHCPNKGKQDLISSRDDGKQAKILLNVTLQYQNCFLHIIKIWSMNQHMQCSCDWYIYSTCLLLFSSLCSKQTSVLQYCNGLYEYGPYYCWYIWNINNFTIPVEWWFRKWI